jgi:hypothetical protein
VGTTLAKRHKGQTASREVAKSACRQRLTITQEEALTGLVNNHTVGKNWAADFITLFIYYSSNITTMNIYNFDEKDFIRS